MSPTGMVRSRARSVGPADTLVEAVDAALCMLHGRSRMDDAEVRALLGAVREVVAGEGDGAARQVLETGEEALRAHDVVTAGELADVLLDVRIAARPPLRDTDARR